MTVGQDLMKKYPIGVSERIAAEIDEEIRKAVEVDRRVQDDKLAKWLTICTVVGLFCGLLAQYFLRS